MRGFLSVLVLSILIPVLAFAGILFARYSGSELDTIDRELLADARQVAYAVDRDLASLQATLLTLATSQALAVDDLKAFHERARTVSQLIGVHILLRDARGQQLANTRVPFGEKLPFEPLAGDNEVIATGKPFISNLMVGAVARRHLFTITAPVIRDGKLIYFLNLSISPERLVTLMEEVRDRNRLSGILDRDGILMVRLPEQDAYIGKRGPSEFFESQPKTEGIWQGRSINGTPVRSAYATSPLTGWVIWVATTEAAARASLNMTLWTLAIMGAALTALALLIAYLVGGRMSRSIKVLANQAAIVGRGGSIEHTPLPVSEIDDVGHSLAAASDELRNRLVQRDEALRDLRQLSESLEKKVSERTSELVQEMRRRETSESALRQVQKMEAIGQLTGGVAHDFNNMLAVVIGSLDLARRRMERGEGKFEKLLDNAAEGARRAATLTQRLLAFARQQPLEPQTIDVNALVSGMSELLRRSIGEQIKLETVLAGGLWRVRADANQLENALLNLAVNGRDAMPEGGKLTIETANAHFDDDYAMYEDVSAGQYVMLALTDTGSGMADEILAKAFDPFFTTKPPGQGTGLGLSQVYGYVKQSGGHIKIYSEAGHGTTVKIYLPRYTGDAETAQAREGKGSIPLGSTDTVILVVEDEAGVRSNTTEILRELGYQVFHADGGASALKLLEDGVHVDLLFTDVVMPEMNGRVLAERAAALRPELKILFTTGYTKNAIVHNATLDAGVNFIGKPFTLDQVARKVAEVLRGGAGPAK